MNIALWVLQILLAAAFLGAGIPKIIMPKQQLAERLGGWVHSFSEPMIKFIGAAEVLGAIGLIVPAATGIAPVLTPLAASGLAILMAGAAITHLRRGERKETVPSLVLGVLSVLVAVARFGPYAF